MWFYSRLGKDSGRKFPDRVARPVAEPCFYLLRSEWTEANYYKQRSGFRKLLKEFKIFYI